MITAAIITLVGIVLKVVFAFIHLPDFPAGVTSSLDYYMDLIFNNLDFLGFFFRGSTISIVATSAVTLFVFSKLYKFTMWVWHKLPISSS